MGVEAARLRPARQRPPTPRDALWFSTADAGLRSTRPTPPTVHAALRLAATSRRFDVGGSVRSAVGALRAALRRRRTRARGQPPTCAPGCPAAPTRRPAATAPRPCVVGADADGPVSPSSSARRVGDRGVPRPLAHARRRPRSKVWEERFGETKYVAARRQAWNAALEDAGIDVADQVDARHRRRHCTAGRPTRSRAKARASAAERVADDWPHRRQPRRRAARAAAGRARSSGPRRARSSRWSCSPTAPTCSCSAPPTRSRVHRPRTPGRRAVAAGAPVALRQVPRAGGACSRSSRRAGPSRPAPSAIGRRPHRGLEVRLRRLGRRRPAMVHLPPVAPAGRRLARCRWPTPRARSSRSPSTGWRTRRARRSCSRSSTSTAAAACRRAHRRRRRRGRDRRPGRDDVPPAVHRRRHPQLLLEGHGRCAARDEKEADMGSHGIKDRVAIVGMGCTPLRASTGTRASTTCSSTPPTRRSPSAGITKDDVDAYWLGTAQSGMSGITLARRCSSRTSPSPASRTSAPPAPRRCARPPTRWRRARTTSRWRSASRR